MDTLTDSVLDDNIKPANNDRANAENFPYDEPLLPSMEINALWGIVWPRVIARAWRENFQGDWCTRLLSGNPKDVAKALESEGFKGGEKYEWFYRNLKIIVKKREDGVAVSKKD